MNCKCFKFKYNNKKGIKSNKNILDKKKFKQKKRSNIFGIIETVEVLKD